MVQSSENQNLLKATGESEGWGTSGGAGTGNPRQYSETGSRVCYMQMTKSAGRPTCESCVGGHRCAPSLFTSHGQQLSRAVLSRAGQEPQGRGAFTLVLKDQCDIPPPKPPATNQSSLVVFWGNRNLGKSHEEHLHSEGELVKQATTRLPVPGMQFSSVKRLAAV